MKVAYLMSPLKINITLPKPDSIVHSYFLVVISFPQIGLHGNPIFVRSSVTTTVVVVAETVFTDPRRKNPMRHILKIFLFIL